ncbi:MAG: glycosyltransferase [Candidatus Bathyarchaeia archaeon]
MKKRLLVISMPFRLGIGGFLRSYNVVPRLTRLFAESDYELELYIPVNAIRTFVSFLMSTKPENMSRERRDILDELLARAIHEVYEVQRSSRYAFAINERLLEKNVEYNRRVILEESTLKSSLSLMLYMEELRPFYIHFFEKRFINMVKHFVKTPLCAYSMHETADAITALTLLSSKETKTTALLQSDLGEKIIHRTFNLNLFKNLSEKTLLRGILSVSPAPIMETPELRALCNNLRVIIPGVAVEIELLKDVSRSKQDNAVIYYGRISREKGIFDLLKAWSIVEKEVDAYLYLAGRFEDYKTKAKFNETIKKYKLKNVKYLGYLDRDKLFKIVSATSVLAYPSYRDSFSLTVLESLFIGLRVVAYRIPALSFLYRQNPNVELIPLGDFKKLALAIISNLNKPFEKDETTKKLLDKYSSWEKVAIEEYRKLSEVLKLR